MELIWLTKGFSHPQLSHTSILTLDGFDFSINEVILNILTKSGHLINDRIRTRCPIKDRLLDILLFEMERYFETQIYLCWLYKAIFCLAYYGLFRIGKLTRSNHVIKAKDVNIGQNKNKILIILYTSKTHGLESRPQEVKITGTAMASQTHNYKPNRQQTNSNQFEQNKQNVKFFCPFEITRKYLMLREVTVLTVNNYLSSEIKARFILTMLDIY